MTKQIKAGIVLKVRFVQSGEKEFSGYIDYIARSDAQRNENFSRFSLYNDYMDNPEKSSPLFTADNDTLSKDEKKLMKQQFQKAQNNGSMMWQDVISFDTRWLIKYGLYDPKTGETDENRLKEVTRASVNQMLEKENMAHSALWTASIHYDKMNHIHVHIAVVEPYPTRSRGKLKPSTLKDMKSKVYNTVLDKHKLHQEINVLIRDRMVAGKKLQASVENRQMRKLFLEIYRHLPPDKRLWTYKTCPDSVRTLVDDLSTLYIGKYHKKEFAELKQKLFTEEQELKTAFGSGEKEKDLYKDFSKNRIQDLYKRMGNTILKELKEYDRKKKVLYASDKKYTGLSFSFIDYTSVNLLKKFLKRDFDSIKNQNAFEYLQEEIEWETTH